MASDGSRHPRLVEVELRTGRTHDVSRASNAGVEEDYISTARLMQFPTTQGDFAYGYLYSPKVKLHCIPSCILASLNDNPVCDICLCVCLSIS